MDRRNWTLSNGRLTFHHPKLPVWWDMPDGFEMPSESILSLAEYLLLKPHGEIVSVVPRDTPSGSRVGVAFSGGIDSAAVLELLPDPIPIYTKVSYTKRRHVLDNALLAVDEVNGLAILSNYDDLAAQFGRNSGYYGPGGFTVTCVLLADHFGLGTVADGNIIEAIYLRSPDGHGTAFGPIDHSQVKLNFEKVKLHYSMPCAGLTEVSTIKIGGHRQYAMGCTQGTDGKPCMNCLKCWRKEALRGNPIPTPPVAEKTLRKPVIPVLATLLWANRNKGLKHPILDAIDTDISWVDRWYPASIEFVPPEHHDFFLAALRRYGIEPIEDISKLKKWSARNTALQAS